MLTDAILDALNDIDPAYIADLEDTLGLLKKQPVSGRKGRRARRVLLIAAILAALALTACAAVTLLRLERRLLPAEELEPSGALSETAGSSGGYLSPYGPADSAEAQASLEWANYQRTHLAEQGEEAWAPEDGDEAFFQGTYGVFDREALDKLYEIRDKYGLSLHTSSLVPLDNGDLYDILGTEPFFLTGDGESWFGARAVYEDGSFTAEGDLALSESVSCFVRLDRNKRGALIPPAVLFIGDPESFEQWETTTALGDTVSVAQRDVMSTEAFLFYEKDPWSVTLHLSFNECVDRADIEAAANCFAFSALCSGNETPDFPSHAPTKSGEGRALTLAELLATKEVRASMEFDKKYAAYLTELHAGGKGYEYEYQKDTVYNFNTYFWAWPSDDPDLNALTNGICEQYALTPAAHADYVIAGRQLKAEDVVDVHGSIVSDPRYIGQAIDTDGVYALLGQEPFLLQGEPWEVVSYGNGCFRMNVSTDSGSFYLHYLKKGGFYTALAFHPVVPPQGDDFPSWVYDTAWGGSVTIALDDLPTDQHPYTSGNSYILYETDGAYIVCTTKVLGPRALESLIDCADLSKLA